MEIYNRPRLVYILTILGAIYLSICSRATEDIVPREQFDHLKWKVNQKQLLLSAQASLQAACAAIDDARSKDIYNDSLSKVTGPVRDIVFNVARYIVAIGQYGETSPEVETFFNSVDAKVGEVWIPPNICFIEEYHRTVDSLAFESTVEGIRFPEPEFRRLLELVEQARQRLKQKPAK